MDQDKISYFFLGLGLGVAVGMLFAPKSGADSRDFLLTKADEGRGYLKRQGEQLRDSADGLVEKSKSAFAAQREQLAAAVEAGKQAYREAVQGPNPQGTPAV